MTKYRNGYVPLSALIKIASGTNGDGYWEHLLSPSQLAKHNALLALAKKRTGKTLAISSGWNAYRPYAAQVAAKKKYGSGAAAPGYSSHGGVYNGHDAMAMDYGNWGSVYGWNKSNFFADARAVGLEPGRISSEPWHVIDNDPWAAVPSGGQGNDMGTLDNTEENYQIWARWQQRAFFYDVRENGFGPDWKLGRTVFEMLRAADDSADVAKIGASVGEEIAKVNITLAGLGTVDLQIDTDKLAAELRAGLAPEIVKALGEQLLKS